MNKAVVRLQKAPTRQQIPTLSPVLEREDVWELSLIKTMLETPSIIENILDYLDASQLQYHSQEFLLALQAQTQHPMLVKLILNDSIKAFNEEDLKNEMLFFLRKYYTQELKKIRNFNDIPFDKKAFLIRQFTEKVNRLKRGELVPFSS